jgi:hypothetical protein
MSFGLSLFAGMFLFSAGSLTVLGWLVFLPLFVGSTGHFALAIYSLLPEKVEGADAVVKETPAKEKEGLKPAPETAGAQS